MLLQSKVCVLTLIRGPFHLPVTAVARKRPQSLCPKCRWKVTPKQAYTHDPTKSEWADYATVQAQSRSLSGNELTRNLSENIRSQSSQLAELVWTDPGIKSGISVHELISISPTNKQKRRREKKRRRRRMNGRTFSQNPRKREERNHHQQQ